MNAPLRSSVWLRNNLCNTVAELKQYGTAILPNGATVYVSGTDTLYRLYKNAGTIYDTLTGLVVIPADQTRNRWMAETIKGAPAWQATMILAAANTVTPSAQNKWTALGSTAGTFTLIDGDPNAFRLNATTSQINYYGPTKRFTLKYQLTITGTAGTNVAPWAAISVANDIQADSTIGSARDKGAQSASFSTGTNCCISGERPVTLQNLDEIRIMLINSSGGEALPVVSAMLSIR